MIDGMFVLRNWWVGKKWEEEKSRWRIGDGGEGVGRE